ncbi:hypothetical protein FVE85_0714 [Porphyridium purpureum]|uniref:Transmembrane protein n=1 Tax=Porphyridium purpureum TaxID=35688 RepID=A0A5J4Z0R9_PORPP|nr:hypothetical protein FVE85_0714 [Porphyridium purpureum]|eukprot:POR8160..scf208_2
MVDLSEKLLEKKRRDDAKYDGFEKKNPSHALFYPQFARGCRSALQGLKFALTDTDARAILKKMIPNILMGTGIVLGVAFLWYVAENQAGLLSDATDGDGQGQSISFLEAFFKSSSYATILASMALNKKLTIDDEMFMLTLRKLEPEFADVVQKSERRKKTAKEYLNKLTRIGKKLAYRLVGKVVRKVSRKAAFFVAPLIRFASLRFVMGTPFAAAMAALEAVPGKQLLEEPILMLGEAFIDSLDLSKDILKPYQKRLHDPKVVEYMNLRYQGNLTGVGFIFELFMNIPIVSILVYMLAECAAAYEVIEIVRRNKAKAEGHKELLGEDALAAEAEPEPTKKEN